MTASTEIVNGAASARSGRVNPLSQTGRNLLAVPKVKKLLNLMIEGEPLREAAKAAGMTHVRARMVLHDPAVRRAYFRGMEVLRESERARNIHLAVKLRDDGLANDATAASKKVALEAARYLDGESASGGGVNVSVSVTNQVAGYVVDLTEPGQAIPHRSAIEAKPLIQHDDVGQGDD